MHSNERITLIRTRLEQALNPSLLEIIDESPLHAGHPGSKTGHGHFAIRIVSSQFKDKTLLACHRMIYAALGDMMENEIHALRIKLK